MGTSQSLVSKPLRQLASGLQNFTFNSQRGGYHHNNSNATRTLGKEDAADSNMVREEQLALLLKD